MKRLTYTVSSATKVNNRGIHKPNEDYLLTDPENGIFILLDGITRVHSEYEENRNQSAACEVNSIFAETVYAFLRENLSKRNIRKTIQEAIAKGNSAIADYRQRKTQAQWGFYPGTLGIIAVLRGGKLHYACAGDCLGMILRDTSRIFFAEQQTVKAVDMKKVTKAERYSIYCNFPENDLSYAVFNGDDSALAGIEQSYIDIHRGDIIFLVTDGIANYIKLEKINILKSQNAEQITEASVAYDVPPFAKYSDDKAIILLSFHE